ncbi:hypothetical protein [Natronoglomus mannanivorans]|uniref:Uncharacterized protein n=1 Tax=Natronoglomus mannanivorans TaxID=2979990 RepID=A0AAP2YY44_9EURY|nr:hypothetical protein [Halobacteria archaeon AArc-xg1-1]
MSDITRRRILAASGVVATGAVAGCLGGSAEADGNGDSESASSSGTVLGNITVENLADQSHTVDVIVEFDGEIEDWSTHELAADDGDSELERNWPTTAGSFRVRARLDTERLIEVTPATWNDPDCLNLLVLVDRAGELTIWSDPGGGPCGDDGAAVVEDEDGEN